LGLEIQLTELDIRNPDNSQWALERQANRYKELVTKLVDFEKRRHKHYGIGILGNNRRDKLAWRISAPVDAEYKAKPAFYAIVNSVPPLPTEPPVQVIPGDVTVTVV